MITPAVAELAAELKYLAGVCAAGQAPRQPLPRPAAGTTGPGPAHAAGGTAQRLASAEQDADITVLTSPRFCDKSVAQTWATLLDEGVYFASMSTMHRLLRVLGQSGDRRAQATHPAKTKPELMATRPGQVWSWDIERHEAPFNRVGVRDHHRRSVAAER